MKHSGCIESLFKEEKKTVSFIKKKLIMPNNGHLIEFYLPARYFGRQGTLIGDVIAFKLPEHH